MSEQKLQSSSNLLKGTAVLAGLAIAGSVSGAEPTSEEQIHRTTAVEQQITPIANPYELKVDEMLAESPASTAGPTASKIQSEPKIFQGSITIKLPESSIGIVSRDATIREDISDEVKTIEKSAESATIPEDISKLMDENVVYVEGGCSGYLIRNPSGQAVGFSYAEHCSVRGIDSTRYNSPTKRNPYITTSIEAFSGQSAKTFVSQGKVGSLFLPEANDFNLDIAIAAFQGYDLNQVITNYNKSKLTPTGLNKLKAGDDIYFAGFPADQPDNPGSLALQKFRASYVGRDVVTLSNGETIEMIVTAVDENSAAAVCSPGASGSRGFTKDNKTVGVLSGYQNLRQSKEKPYQSDEYIAYYTNRYGVDLTGKAALCMFAFKSPKHVSANRVNVVESISEIPGGEKLYDADETRNRITKQFYDPKVIKHVVNGIAQIITISWTYDEETQSIEQGETTYKYIKNVVLMRDALSKVSSLVYSDPTAKDGLGIIETARGGPNVYFYSSGEAPDIYFTYGSVSKTEGSESSATPGFYDNLRPEVYGQVIDSSNPILATELARHWQLDPQSYDWVMKLTNPEEIPVK